MKVRVWGITEVQCPQCLRRFEHRFAITLLNEREYEAPQWKCSVCGKQERLYDVLLAAPKGIM